VTIRAILSDQTSVLDAAIWDRWVSSDPRGHLLQTWAWGELKGAFGWTPVRVAIERDGSLAAGAQVLYRRVGPLSIGYIPKGPVLIEEEGEAVELLWQTIQRCSRRMRAIMLKVEPEWRDEDASRHNWWASWGLRASADCVQPRRTIMVDIAPAESDILARMKPKWRYNIHLSERKGVEVREGSADDLTVFYDLMRVTGERDHFGIHSPAYYRRAWELFAPSGRAVLFMAYHQGQPLAGLMAYAFNGQAWYMYGASSNEYRHLMSNHQLQWRAMRWAKGKGCTQYDLWGIPDADPRDADDEPLGGVGRFKGGFGGQVVRYVGAYDYVYSQPLYWAMQKLWARRRAAAQEGDTPNSA